MILSTGIVQDFLQSPNIIQQFLTKQAGLSEEVAKAVVAANVSYTKVHMLHHK